MKLILKLKMWSLYNFGDPLHAKLPEHESWSGTGSGRRSGLGCPLCDWFHQGSPDGAASSTNTRITEVSIETFGCGKGWLLLKRVKVLLIWTAVIHLEAALWTHGVNVSSSYFMSVCAHMWEAALTRWKMVSFNLFSPRWLSRHLVAFGSFQVIPFFCPELRL